MSEVHRLTGGVNNAFADARVWLQNETYPLRDSAVRLHHQLVRVHPWPNGNGRHARLMADILAQLRCGAELTWGLDADIGTPGKTRANCLECILQADVGNVAPLLAFARS